MPDQPDTNPNDLSFDRAIPVTPVSVGGSGGVSCANCNRSINDSYFTANGEPVCESCRAVLGRSASATAEPAALSQALFFGLVATLASALIYWAVIRVDREWPIVAIACGWIIGKGMRKGAGGRGGRELQIVGALLVYLSVALAHFPFVFEAAVGRGISAGAAFFHAFLIPVRSIASGGVSGVLYAVIIFFGMAQAWQQMARHPVAFEGPFRVGGATA